MSDREEIRRNTGIAQLTITLGNELILDVSTDLNSMSLVPGYGFERDMALQAITQALAALSGFPPVLDDPSGDLSDRSAMPARPKLKIIQTD